MLLIRVRFIARVCVRVCVCVRVKNFVSVKRKERKKSLLLLRFRCKIFRVSHPAKNPSAKALNPIRSSKLLHQNITNCVRPGREKRDGSEEEKR